MSKPTLYITKGASGSGKTTWAKEMVLESKGRVKNVCKDDLRAMLDCSVWSKQNEALILKARDALILQYIEAGYDVICSDVNFNPQMERSLRKLVGNRANVEVKIFEMSVEDCIARDAQRTGIAQVGEKVIRDQFKQWERWHDADCSVEVADFAPIEQNMNLPRAVIVDIDGTIARKSDQRGYYDWHRVGEDSVIAPVKDLVNLLWENFYYVIMFSGRDGCCYEETSKWLKLHDIKFDDLFMRAADDMRPDDIVKSEMFDKHIAGNWNIAFVVDDRPKVVRMWRNRGLFVLDVNQPMKEF